MGMNFSDRIKRRRPSAALIVAILALIAALGGVAIASIPSADGTIHGCYNGQGALRVIDAEGGATCAPGETALNWNQTGPPGPAGPSQAFEGFRDVGKELRPIDRQLVSLGGIPPGDYVLTAKMWVRSVADHSRYVDCFLRAGAQFDHTSTRLETNGDNATRGVLAFDLATRFMARSNRIFLTCAATGERPPGETTHVFPYDIKIIAIKVGSVTTHGIS
jgi:hypothetical protein